ncbi:hypothetical protein [Actinopolymorpha alba]|uniref:hypothetical protein n=1 Tax=Actinopolymorpha alba TaxID=533267 RepID=UPI00037BD37B|nr:hypothetical protein [Actinopolymorpha alba]
MTDQLEQQLTHSLHRQADRVDELSQRNLAPAAFQLGRRMRQRRRVGTAVAAGVAAVAVLVPATYALTGGPGERTRVEPAATMTAPTPSTPSASPSPSSPSSPSNRTPSPRASSSVTLEFSRLALGKTPTIPWLAEQQIFNGSTTTPVKATHPVSFQPVAGGYVLHDLSTDPSRVRLIGIDGTEKLSVPGSYPVVSRDGRYVAWADLDKGFLVLADALNGEALERADVGRATPIGFLRGLVVFTPNTADSPNPQAWNPETGEITTWKGLYNVSDVADGPGLAAVRTEDPAVTRGVACSAVVDLNASNRRLWRTCTSHVQWLSSDGRYAVTYAPEMDGLGAREYTFVEARTGQPVLTLKAAVLQNISWEGDGRFLVEVWDNDRASLVRCSMTGACELALGPRKSPAPEDGAPYQLPSR